MTVGSGVRIGPYEIQSAFGFGGMGRSLWSTRHALKPRGVAPRRWRRCRQALAVAPQPAPTDGPVAARPGRTWPCARCGRRARRVTPDSVLPLLATYLKEGWIEWRAWWLVRRQRGFSCSLQERTTVARPWSFISFARC